MFKKVYDPADIPIFILKPSENDSQPREVAFMVFKTGLVWDKTKQRMLSAQEVTELFEEPGGWCGVTLKA